MSQKRHSDFSFANARGEKNRPSGFTLIEMMVVIAIIIIVTGVVITSQGSFNKTLVLTNTAYDVALTLRFAETYGIGSHVLGSAVNTGYGLRFTTGTTNSFTLFADTYPAVTGSGTACHPAPGGANSAISAGPSALSGNCVYDSNQGEKVQDYTLGNNITIADFCAQTSSGWSCTYAHDGASSGLTSLDIVFSRPNPTPFMSANGAYSTTFPVTAACIALKAPTSAQTELKYVSVGASGQISTNATHCP